MRDRRAAGPVASDLRITYSRAVEAAARILESLGDMPAHRARVAAENAMRDALPPRLQAVADGKARA
jgi:hypothetical protein